jgi:hypothetical protein
MQHGWGVYKYPDGDIQYRGYWKNQKKDFWGKYYFKHRTKSLYYVGQFSNDKFNGIGTVTYSDGSTYQGFWVNNRRHGYGKYFSKEKSVYRGYWKNGLKHGFTYIINYDQSKFIGNFRGGKKFGEGLWIDTTGKRYSGFWYFDTLVGNSTIFATNGDKYIGSLDFRKEASGCGTLVKVDGTVYHGQFRKGVYNGYGEEITKDGNSYKGSFKNGVYHGYGERVVSYSCRMDWVVIGKPWNREYIKRENVLVLNSSGSGVRGIGYSVGEKTLGEYKNGVIHGEGLLIDQNGRKFSGVWKSGGMVNWMRNIFKFRSRFKYRGNRFMCLVRSCG